MNRRKSLLIWFTVPALSILLLIQFIGVKENRPDSDPGMRRTQAEQPGQKADSGGQSDLRVAVSLPPDEFELLKRASEDFERTEAGLTVSLENVAPGDYYAVLKKAGQTGDAPDVMLVDNSWVGEFAALGFLHPVDDYFTGDQQSRYVPSVLEQVKWNGYIWGIPKDIDPYVLVWSKKTTAGKWAQAPSGRDDLIAWNKAFMKPEDGLYGIYFDPTDYMALLSVFSPFAGPVPEKGNPLAKAADAGTLKAVQSFLVPQENEWNAKTYAKNFPVPSKDWNPWDLMKQGKMAGAVTSLSQYRLNRSPDLTLAAVPFPSGGKSAGVWLRGRSFSISSRSTHLAAAAGWIKIVTAPEAESAAWERAGMLPVLLSGYQSGPVRLDPQYESLSWLVREGRALPFVFDAAARAEQARTDGSRLLKGEIGLKEYAEILAKP